MRPNKQFFLIEINAQEQEDRKILIPGTDIKIPDTVADFKYYLQAAPIIAMGINAEKYFPEARIGDYLIFHHTIEFDEWRLLNERVTTGLPPSLADKKDIYLQIIVEASIDDVFGIQKADTLEIIPSHEQVWCEEMKEPTSFELEITVEDGTKNSILAFVTDTEGTLRSRIEELQSQSEFLGRHGKFNHEKMMELKKEQESITKELNKSRAWPLKVAYINNVTSRQLETNKGDIVLSNGWIGYKGYPLSVQDLYKEDGIIKKRNSVKEYLIVRAKFLLGLKT